MQQLNTYIFDVDDTLYPIDCGLHDRIKERILAHARSAPEVLALALATNGRQEIKEEDLNALFPRIVMLYAEKSTAALDEYYAQIFGNDYHLIPKNPSLVKAIKDLQAQGKRIVIYTNGPSAVAGQAPQHVQKALSALGFDADFIEAIRHETYDLTMSVKAGAGKPSLKGFQNMLAHFNIKAKESVFIDDSVSNLATAHKLGLKTVWAWTSRKKPREQDNFQAAQIGALRIREIADISAEQSRLFAKTTPGPCAKPARRCG